ncbi:transcriptional regulator [Terrilactibacillus sp. BCM23-1]|uniref:Transcriptional regulator n=1 Tax=Terrilactibacillus tamarindi TaxID=2599694 RepID=A0A6N8CQA3_9BACI|nr:tetratricopeptide repeat protein [Terrilactibacillus tamarindi]MTT31115.1 transcriptional regulator [Terrilactibacillus tamarindi]
MAELEDRNCFSELLSLGIKTLKKHLKFKTKKENNNHKPSKQSYLDYLAYHLGISSNTVKSWMGQMGSKYIPGRIEDGKLFGAIWIILNNSDMDIQWFTRLLQSTSIPVINPAIPEWVVSCFKKSKTLRSDGTFGAPLDHDIEEVVKRLFQNHEDPKEKAIEIQPLAHNLPTRWSDDFIGRENDMEAIRNWMVSASPVCLITGWAGMGKTTLALESAYACLGDRGESQMGHHWPTFSCIIWVSADLGHLSFSDFLNTMAYQLGRVELMDKPINEKRFVVRNALATYSRKKAVLLIVDSIDTADNEISQFIINLPPGVKALLTSREGYSKIQDNAFLKMYAISLNGLKNEDALTYLKTEISRQFSAYRSQDKSKKMKALTKISPKIYQQLISATAGNPKVIALSIAYIIEDDIDIQKLIQEIETAGYSLLELFEFLFGRTWENCHEDTRILWQSLGFFNNPPDRDSWASVSNLSLRRFHYAVEQMRTYALIQPEYLDGKLHYRAHQTVVAYGEQRLLENEEMETISRDRWAHYYINYLDKYLKRSQPNIPYWNYLLGRDLEKIKVEWPNIRKVIEWTCTNEKKELLIQFVSRISHFLSRVNLPLRIEYGLKAAEAANDLQNPLLEALFRIDTVGWALTEMDDLNEGLKQIEAGLQILDSLNAELNDVNDLKILGISLKSKIYLKKMDLKKASNLLEEIMDRKRSTVIEHRVLLTQGDLNLLSENYKKAIQFYEKANRISLEYGGEKTIEAYFNLGIAYVKCKEYEKAKLTFEHVLYNKTEANHIELIYYNYGKANLYASMKDYRKALKFNGYSLKLIDSWEQTISIRNEVETFNTFLKGACHSPNCVEN